MKTVHEHIHTRIVEDVIKVVDNGTGTFTVTVNGIKRHHDKSLDSAKQWARDNFPENKD